MATAALTDALQAYFSRRLGDAGTVRIQAIDERTEGFSQETLSVELEISSSDGATETKAYVIKREPIAGLLEPYDLEPEFRVLHALGGSSILAPPTPWFEREPGELERPFYVMERLSGEAPVPAPRADGSPPLSDEARLALAPQVAEQLARLHAVDVDGLGLAFLSANQLDDPASAEIKKWRARVERARLGPDPMLERAFLWLEMHKPAASERTLLHGDYRMGNFLVTQEGPRAKLTGILDWEMVHIGDPIEDVAWLCSRMWRAQTPYASCLVEPERLVEMYECFSGRRVDPERLRFWSVLAVVKMLAIMHTGIRAFLDGRTDDPRMATFDHQAVLLRALLGVELGMLPEL